MIPYPAAPTEKVPTTNSPSKPIPSTYIILPQPSKLEKPWDSMGCFSFPFFPKASPNPKNIPKPNFAKPIPKPQTKPTPPAPPTPHTGYPGLTAEAPRRRRSSLLSASSASSEAFGAKASGRRWRWSRAAGRSWCRSAFWRKRWGWLWGKWWTCDGFRCFVVDVVVFWKLNVLLQALISFDY